ncbi:MAG: hypothetical protein ACJASZ_001763, partial [Yoonia sp.]
CRLASCGDRPFCVFVTAYGPHDFKFRGSMRDCCSERVCWISARATSIHHGPKPYRPARPRIIRQSLAGRIVGGTAWRLRPAISVQVRRNSQVKFYPNGFFRARNSAVGCHLETQCPGSSSPRMRKAGSPLRWINRSCQEKPDWFYALAPQVI